MSLIATLRHNQSVRTRRVVGLFVLAWLVIAIQPCVMALGGESDHDCPHCPPAHEMHAGDHGHSGHHGTPTPVSSPCSDGTSDCDGSELFKHDGRVGDIKPKDPPPDTPAVLLPRASVAQPAARAVSVRAATGPIPAGVPPPLNLLYCTFLN